MAIAYYIPDQSKLAASGSSFNSSTTTETAETSNSGNDSSPSQTQSASQNFIASIKIPLRSFCLNSFFCWDLVAQVFCYALKFCHHPSSSPASASPSSAGNNGFFRISLEFSNYPQPEETSSAGSTSTTDPPVNHNKN